MDGKQIKKNLGLVLKELRTHLGLTQEKFAEKINLQHQTIAKIESGKMFVSSDNLAELCNIFNVEPSIFFTKKVNIFREDNAELIEEIVRMLPSFDREKLQYIHDILLVLKK